MFSCLVENVRGKLKKKKKTNKVLRNQTIFWSKIPRCIIMQKLSACLTKNWGMLVKLEYEGLLS